MGFGEHSTHFYKELKRNRETCSEKSVAGNIGVMGESF